MARLRDPVLPFRQEVEAARAWSTPRSVFLGRPMPGPGEPLWLAEDRWWAMALLAVEADTCNSCGQSLTLSTHLDGEGAFNSELVTCHGCRAAAMRVKAKQDEGAQMDGAQVRVWQREERWP